MSRVSKQPVPLPKGVTATISADSVTVKGSKGMMSLGIDARRVKVVQEEGELRVEKVDGSREANMTAGTIRSHLANLVQGVNIGYERKLELVGVGYRAQAQGSSLNLNLGFSHPVVYQAPEGITVETPSQTEILVKGTDIQRVGQAAADIRRFRPPEPYKGKGVRYAGEKINLKEAKKK